MDKQGNLYSTTYERGSGNYDTIFRLAINDPDSELSRRDTEPQSHRVRKKACHPGRAQRDPGPSTGGCPNQSLNAATLVSRFRGNDSLCCCPPPLCASACSKLYSFHGTDGAHPEASPVVDKSGTLYAETYEGDCCGTVFKIKE